MVCAFFKQGQCTKGDKCKFSHDLSLERKCEKRSVYIDARDEELEKGRLLLGDGKKTFSPKGYSCITNAPMQLSITWTLVTQGMCDFKDLPVG